MRFYTVIFAIVVVGCSFEFPEIDMDSGIQMDVDAGLDAPTADAGVDTSMNDDASADVDANAGDAGIDSEIDSGVNTRIENFSVVQTVRFSTPSRFSHPVFNNIVSMSGMEMEFGVDGGTPFFRSNRYSSDTSMYSSTDGVYVAQYGSLKLDSDPTSGVNITIDMTDVSIEYDHSMGGNLEGFVTINDSIGTLIGAPGSVVNLCSWLAGFNSSDPCDVTDIPSWPNFPNALCDGESCNIGGCAVGTCNAWYVVSPID